jgi:phage antirepressor YoqD-like protein
MTITPRADGLITIKQAAALCGVTERTVRQWTRRGYTGLDGKRHTLEVKSRDGWLLLVDPVDVAVADNATKIRARRFVVRGAAA